jgi:DNA-binding response OmpR family regulator
MDAPKTVLIVDDETNARLLAGVTLRNHGYRVLEARDADEAEAMLARAPVDCIVLDVMMPGRTGLELCAQLKERPPTAAIPVLIVSGIGVGLPGRAAAIKAGSGADDVLGKPFQLAELVERVGALIGVPKS